MSGSIRKKIIKVTLSLIAFALMCTGDGIYAETVIGPDMTVKIYFDAYIAQDWEMCTEYLHPELLENLKARIIDMIEEVSETTRKELFRQYHVRAVSELEKMPCRQMYILYLQNRWKELNAQSNPGLGAAELFFIKTQRINNDECIVEFKSSITQQNQTVSNLETYYLKKHDGRWKICDTQGLKKLREGSKKQDDTNRF